VGRSLPELRVQLEPGDELIVVDNDSSDATPDAIRELVPDATLIEAGSNVGFAAGCNRGAAVATTPLLVFLNPDATPLPGFRKEIERPLADGRDWAAWQGLVTAERGSVVNTRGGVIHFTGIAWAGGAGEPVSEPAPLGEPGFVSGACLAIPRARFERLGGFAEDYFLYHEDVDLSLRVRLDGGRLGVESAARVDHDYEFAKGPVKWRRLERNRWATIIRTYPAMLLVLLLPAFVITELALIPISIAGGWLGPKLASWCDLARSGARLARERRRIQQARAIPLGEFAAALTADLDTPYLGAAARSRPLRIALRAYWSLVSLLLGGGRSAGSG
jgi:N-acetylglucosaminyl-diphospho-decaprenol L-rhamnosyltransferase